MSNYPSSNFVKKIYTSIANAGVSVEAIGSAVASYLNSHPITVDTKVDKVAGKDLSSNDLTDTLKANYDTAYSHSQSSHAPATAQKNSDIYKAEIEAKLTGVISTHTHAQNVINVTLSIGTINN